MDVVALGDFPNLSDRDRRNVSGGVAPNNGCVGIVVAHVDPNATIGAFGGDVGYGSEDHKELKA